MPYSKGKGVVVVQNDAMPLCSNCYRQPCQMADICLAAKQEKLTPEAFVFKYWVEIGLSPDNRFLCSDCREKFLYEEREFDEA